MFIKTSWSNSLIYLWKLISVYIFKLDVGHSVLIGAAEVIHISTVTLAFSVLFHWYISLYFLSVYRDQWGASGFLYKNHDFYWVFYRNELKTKPVIFCGLKDLRENKDLIWRFRLNNNFQFIGSQGKIQFNPPKIATKGFSTDSVRI